MVEGQNVTLQWTYNIKGTLDIAKLSKENTVIIKKDTTEGLFVKPSYRNRTTVNRITDSQTSITLFNVSSTSDSGNYTFKVMNNKKVHDTRKVEIIILCKYTVATA